MKHRLVAMPKIPPKPEPQTRLDGLRIVLAACGEGLTAITNNGLEIPIELSLAGLNKLHEMLCEQARKKDIGSFLPIARFVLAEWARVGPTGAGKVHESEIADFKARKRLAAFEALPDL